MKLSFIIQKTDIDIQINDSFSLVIYKIVTIDFLI